MVDKEQAISMVKSYLKFISNENRYKLTPIYDSYIFSILHDFFLYFEKDFKFRQFIKPNRFEQVAVYDDTTTFVFYPSSILENEYCWGFFWNTKKYFETKMSKYSITGNGIIIIDKLNARLYQSPSFKGANFMLNDFCDFKEGEKSKVNWNYCQRIYEDGEWKPRKFEIDN